MRTRYVAWLFLAALSSGCAFFRGNDLERIQPAGLAEQAGLEEIRLRVAYNQDGRPIPRIAVAIGQIALEGLQKAGARLSESPDAAQVDLIFDEYIHHRTLAVVTGVLSGLTLTLFPGYVSGDYVLDATVTTPDGNSRNVTYKDSYTFVTQILLLPVWPFLGTGRVPREIQQNMIYHALRDLAAEPDPPARSSRNTR